MFINREKFTAALKSGRCTHTDIRNVLGDAVDASQHPALNDAIRECLAGSFCHLIVDEAFDMNPLDIAIVQRAIEAELSITVVGDRWQSLYEFRGSRPEQVDTLLDSRPFRQIDMPGEHRYTSAEMRKLARALFRTEPFQVKPAGDSDSFDVVLAHDWGTLWGWDRIMMLPAGKASRIDRSLLTSCLVLLLNEFVQEMFGLEASGVGEARRAHPHPNLSERLAPAMQGLRDPSHSEGDIWELLRVRFQPAGARAWPSPGTMARRYLSRLMTLARHDGRLMLGLSVHQAKGLEWDRVLFLDGQLSTHPLDYNRLDINKLSHRNVYVALTRARSKVRIAYVPPEPYGHQRSPIERPRKRAVP